VTCSIRDRYWLAAGERAKVVEPVVLSPLLPAPRPQVERCGHCGRPDDLRSYPDHGRKFHEPCYARMCVNLELSRVRRLQKYNIDLDFYEQMLAEQGGACGACGEPPQPGQVLCVDHDHACCPGQTSCGRCVRGLLCHDCNRAAGYLRDNVQTVEGLARYLRGRVNA